jgi:hypothetical protein
LVLNSKSKSFTLTEEHALRMFENKVLRRKVEPRRRIMEEITQQGTSQLLS